MSSDVISGCREAPAGEPMADLLRQLCAEEALSPEETAAVVRRAMCEPDIAPVEWPSGLVPHFRRFVPGRPQAGQTGWRAGQAELCPSECFACHLGPGPRM